MKKTIWIAVLLCSVFVSNWGFAQQKGLGAALTAMGGTGTVGNSVWHAADNPAGIAGISKTTIGLAWQDRFAMKELRTGSLVATVPWRKNSFGFQIHSYGYEYYRQILTGLSYAKQLSPAVSVGLKFNYHQVSVPGYVNDGAVSVEIGSQVQLNQYLVLGAHIANPTFSKYAKEVSTQIPVNFRLGLAYQVSDKLVWNNEFDQGLSFTASYKTGVSYQVHDIVWLAGGIQTAPFRQFGGFGLIYKTLHVNMAMAFSQPMGYTPVVGVDYAF